MRLDDCVEQAVRQVKKTKEWTARKGPADMNPEVTVYRGDAPVALIVIADMSREGLVRVARAAASGLDADVLVSSFESYRPTPPQELWQRVLAGDAEAAELARRNPLTGKPWAQGEMQEAVASHDALGKGWITECITIYAVNKAGDVASRQLPFRYVGGKHLSWREDLMPFLDHNTVDNPSLQFGGYIPEALIDGMNRPSVSVRHPDLAAATSREEMDAAFASHMRLNRHGAVILLNDLDENTLRRKGFRD